MGILRTAYEHGLYLAELMENPYRLGAMAPTSDTVLKQVVPWVRGSIGLAIDAGAGTGGLERKFRDARKIDHHSKIFATEPSHRFADFMREEFAGDERIQVIEKTLEDAQEEIMQSIGVRNRIHQLFTTVPMSALSRRALHTFLKTGREMMENDGETFAYIFTDMTDDLRRFYDHVVIEKKIYGQIWPPRPYLLHHAYVRRPTMRIFDPLLFMKKPSPAPPAHSVHAPSPA